MKSLIASLVAVFALAGCVAVPYGGPGGGYYYEPYYAPAPATGVYFNYNYRGGGYGHRHHRYR